MDYTSIQTHENGLTYLAIDTPLCEAKIFLQGAQIVHFQPKGMQPLLWVSSADDYQAGNGIRGGVPVCWPWFGQHSNKDFPQHGFARTSIWTLDSTEINHDVATIRLSLNIDEENRRFWPHNTQVKIEFILSQTLQINLINENLSDETIELTQALHSYFPIDDIHLLVAEGFADSSYMEFGEGPYLQETDMVKFDRETDRVYNKLSSVQYLNTGKGTIQVERENSHSAVLWNPWIDKSVRLSRFNDDDYLHMVCLEAANVIDDKVVIKPKETHTLTTKICWKKC